MLKHYSCACGWEATEDTLEELLEKIKKHAEKEHPGIPFNESNIRRFIQDVEE